MQKYEKGTNRISASRLHQMAGILQVAVPFFFEGAPQAAGQSHRGGDMPSPTYISEFIATADGLKYPSSQMYSSLNFVIEPNNSLISGPCYSGHASSRRN